MEQDIRRLSPQWVVVRNALQDGFFSSKTKCVLAVCVDEKISRIIRVSRKIEYVDPEARVPNYCF